MFSLAHLSDVHLSPLPRVRLAELRSKRFIGYLSWLLRRKAVHRRDIADLIASDITAQAVDHIALTGDLVNIAAGAEFTQATKWLEEFAKPDELTFVPGNHDAYVRVPWEQGLGYWANYMTGDLRAESARGGPDFSAPLPFVRQRRNVALIGVSSAYPAPWTQASGRLGTAQIEALAAVLSDLAKRGFYRILLIHHPPLPGQAVSRKALLDASDLKAVLETEGAELVLHGHNHEHMHEVLSARSGQVNIIGVPSASARASGEKPPAAWYLHRIRRHQGSWKNEVTVRTYDAKANKIVTQTNFTLYV